MIRSDSVNAFVENLATKALNSTAVNHPYLRAISCGDFANINLVLKDFAFQYGFYSGNFTCYMTAVINNLENIEHKRIMQTNLAEEQGDTHGVELAAEVLDSVIGQPHASLFQRFQKALEVDANQSVTTQSIAVNFQPGMVWSEEFLKLCEKNQYVGVGAIGVGTELIVSRIYHQILQGLKNHSNLTAKQRVFFDLHSQCDDEHGEQMLCIADNLATDKQACEQIEYGVNMAINLRTTFWDKMLERASSFAALPVTEKLTDLE